MLDNRFQGKYPEDASEDVGNSGYYEDECCSANLERYN